MDMFLGFIVFIIVILIWVYSARNFSNSGGSAINDMYWNGSNLSSYSSGGYVSYSQRQSNRSMALQKAQLFIKPYKNLMGEHCLTNEYVKVNLVIEKNGDRKIVCVNKIAKNGKRKMFTATVNPDFRQYYLQPLDYVVDYLWDSICMGFSYTTVYENISSASVAAMLMLNESEIDSAPSKTSVGNVKRGSLLNINQATEAELLALPGVNIIMAKKAVKYIERNGGFASVEDFIKKMKIKDTFVEQIKAITYVSQGRSIDEVLPADDDSPRQNPQPKPTQADFTDNYSKNTKPGNDDNNGNERIIDL